MVIFCAISQMIQSKDELNVPYGSADANSKGVQISERRVGGRCNYRGVPLVYLAESTALTTLKVLIHLQDTETFSKYAVAEIRFDNPLVQKLSA